MASVLTLAVWGALAFSIDPSPCSAQLGWNASGPNAQGGAPLVTPMPASTIGVLEVELPDTDRFVLRGTLPLPRNAHGGKSGYANLAVVEAGGVQVPAQLEIMSRYASPDHGADVVEVVARVRRPSAFAPGTRVRYPVVWKSHSSTQPAKPSNPISALTNGPQDLPSTVTSLLGGTQNLRLEARDVFGHRYRMDLLGSGNVTQLLKHGPHRAETKVSGTMMPVNPVSGSQGTLPHFLGADAYIGTFAGEPVVTLDLRIHNAHDGNDKTTSADDPLGKVYFERIELHVPSGYQVYEAFDAPGTGSSVINGSVREWRLVEPLPNGKLHVIGQQGQFHRRLAIAPPSSAARAADVLASKGLGFARRATTPSGGRTWSWWNPETSRWFPQRFTLPHLEHVGMSALRSTQTQKLAEVLSHYESGKGTGAVPYVVDRLGWAHPWGITYGGMTGGPEINLVDGVQMIESASLEGYRTFQLVHIMNTDRQCNVLYSRKGRPTSLYDWVQKKSSGQEYVPFQFFMGLIGSNDPFGFDKAPTFQQVAAQSKKPPYEETLLSFQPHDSQHLIRYTRNAKVLAWAANDSLAKDDVWAQAELARLTYHYMPNNQSNYEDATGLLSDIHHTDTWPGRGVDFGRHEGWIVDTVTAAYAMNSPEWRAQGLYWFSRVNQMLAKAIVPCTGHIQARVQNKMLDGKYMAAQSFEDSIVHNALEGMYETAFYGHSPTNTALLRDTMIRTYQAFIGPLEWNHVLHGPKDIFAIGPPNVSDGVWCWPTQQPADGYVPTVNTYQTFSSLGYAFQMTWDAWFLVRAAEMMGGADPLKKLYQQGAQNIENRAALLAAAQLLMGEL